MNVTENEDRRLRIAAIDFLNPAPLMWDFEHPPLDRELALRYRIDRMLPSECARRLASGEADLGLIPIAALPAHPQLKIIPGSTIASKGRVRSLLLVRRAGQPLAKIRSLAADTASRTTVTYARLLFHKWGNGGVTFLPMAADLDRMLSSADAALVIGDPAMIALEDKEARAERTGEQLVYHDMAEEWRSLTGLPFVSALWCMGSACNADAAQCIAEDTLRSREHGLAHIDEIAQQWTRRLALSPASIRSYLTENIHYVLDEECLEGIRGFFSTAQELGVLPAYELPAGITASPGIAART